MAHLPEIPTSAYTPEMDILGVIPNIPVSEGDRVPVSRNALTPGTRPLQLLPLPGCDFLVQHDTDAMRGFQSKVDLGKARTSGSSTDASAFWDLLAPPMQSRVVAARFGDYATGLRRTQPRFSPAMRYALMEWWNDCTHLFIFGFGEMTLTPAYFTTITGLGFDGEAVPLDSRYQTATLGAELVGTLLGVPTRTRYTVQGGSGESNWQFLRSLEVWAYEYRIYPGGPESDTSTEARRIPRYLAHRHHTFSSSEDPQYWRCYLNDRALADLFLTPWEGDAWASYRPRALAEALTRSRVLLQGYWVDQYFLGESVLEIRTVMAQRRVPVAPPRHMYILEGMTPEDRLMEYDGFPADDYLIPGD
ncbi:hypothetical protein JCGZ_19324 [Jatropha curcas]|uniref:Aminotransferase-like plant mobile domain-containing protein n=1 Tax=Jatropha curcas TaxID=180498 RepID=A0A067KB40_JATCU|nr:hypothetical protein JCGZ_19324 [Jatropha curcas]